MKKGRLFVYLIFLAGLGGCPSKDHTAPVSAKNVADSVSGADTIAAPVKSVPQRIDWCAHLNFELPRKLQFFDSPLSFLNEAGEVLHTRPLEQKRHLGRTYKRFGLYSAADSLLFTSDYFWFKEGEYSEIGIDEKESYPISRTVNFKTGEIEKRRNQKTLNDIYMDRFEWEILTRISCEAGGVTNWQHISLFSRMASHSPPPKMEAHIQLISWSNVHGLMGFQLFLDDKRQLLFRIPRPTEE